jgi:TetR/AcrR family transcriptional repressor of nem operon
MKRTKEVTAEARKTVVQAASKMLRARGIDGVSVSDVMAAAGMTHGGFYKLFEDKDALVEEAFDLASKESARALRDSAEQASSGRGIQAMVDAYLSREHCASPGTGCALAAHASEASRQGSGFRRAFTTGVYRLLDSVLEVASRDGRPMRRQEGLAMLAFLVGALALARGTDDEDLASEILGSVRSRVAALALGGSDAASPPAKEKGRARR